MANIVSTPKTNKGIDYRITIIEEDGSADYSPPVIDLDTQTSIDGWGNHAVRYIFEFDMSNENHNFSTTDLIDTVIFKNGHKPFTFSSEVIHAGPSVVKIESMLEPVDNPIGDILDDATTWISDIDSDSDDADSDDSNSTVTVNDPRTGRPLTVKIVIPIGCSYE